MLFHFFQVNVEDVNDNAPRFTSCPESVTVEENLSPGAIVTVLQATDSDRGEHANIEYFIEVHCCLLYRKLFAMLG